MGFRDSSVATRRSNFRNCSGIAGAAPAAGTATRTDDAGTLPDMNQTFTASKEDNDG